LSLPFVQRRLMAGANKRAAERGEEKLDAREGRIIALILAVALTVIVSLVGLYLFSITYIYDRIFDLARILVHQFAQIATSTSIGEELLKGTLIVLLAKGAHEWVMYKKAAINFKSVPELATGHNVLMFILAIAASSNLFFWWRLLEKVITSGGI